MKFFRQKFPNFHVFLEIRDFLDKKLNKIIFSVECLGVNKLCGPTGLDSIREFTLPWLATVVGG